MQFRMLFCGTISACVCARVTVECYIAIHIAVFYLGGGVVGGDWVGMASVVGGGGAAVESVLSSGTGKWTRTHW